MIGGCEQRLEHGDSDEVQLPVGDEAQDRRIFSRRACGPDAPHGVGLRIAQVAGEVREDRGVALALTGRAHVELSKMDQEIDQGEALRSRQRFHLAEQGFIR